MRQARRAAWGWAVDVLFQDAKLETVMQGGGNCNRIGMKLPKMISSDIGEQLHIVILYLPSELG
jgi:hypothetical protein